MFAFKIGTDPEVFLNNPEGKKVSAHDLIPGTKHEPHKVLKGALQPDGLSAEFNIDPAETEEEFLGNIETVLGLLKEQVNSVRPDLVVSITPTAFFDKEYFDSLPSEAKVLGCTPDMNAYTMSENDPPFTDEPFRTGAGHIHIGWGSGYQLADYDHSLLCVDVVKQLDAVLYFASLLWDRDDKRRSLYGKIGAFRIKSYGVEYRPLSNAYLCSKKTQKLTFRLSRDLSDLLMNKGVRIFDDPKAIEMVDRVQRGEKIPDEDVNKYLSYIESTYGVLCYLD